MYFNLGFCGGSVVKNPAANLRDARLTQVQSLGWEDVLENEMTTRFLCPWDFPGKNTGVHCSISFFS